MLLTTKQAGFVLFFLLGWLLLLLLGESYLDYFLLAAWSLFFLFFVGELEWRRLEQHRWLGVGWGLFLLSLGVSLFFSLNLPLSLHAVARYTLVFLCFWFFFLLKKSFISSVQLIKALLLITGVILSLSLAFIFFPHLAQLLPGMNLLYATYGHNHLAALLLLLIPASWWVASEYVKAGQSRWWWSLPLGLTLGLLTSFGRVGVAIGLLQFVVIARWLKKAQLVKKYRLQLIFRAVTVLFMVVLLTKVVFSLATLVKPDFTCPVPKFKKQLCKSIELESRPQYWRWAVAAVKDRPQWGSGPGTFSLVAKKYRLAFQSSTAYAHNAFLQAFAELGLLGGGVWLSLSWGLLYLAAKSLNKKTLWSWPGAAFLGVGAIYLDVLFDFDWDFVGILSLTMILLALLLKEHSSSMRAQTKDPSAVQLMKVIWWGGNLGLVVLAGLYLTVEILLRSGQVSQAFAVFPYFHWHRKIYEAAPSLSQAQFHRLGQIYQFQPDIYPSLMAAASTSARRQQLLEQEFLIAPWSVMSRPQLVSYYLERQDWASAAAKLIMIEQLYQDSAAHGHPPSYQQQQQLASWRLAVAQGLLAQGQSQSAWVWLQKMMGETAWAWEDEELAAQLLVKTGNQLAKDDMTQTITAYNLAKEHLPWILSTQRLWFEQSPRQLDPQWSALPQAQLMTYFQLTTTWSDEELGWRGQTQRQLQEEFFQTLFIRRQWSELAQLMGDLDWQQHDYQWRQTAVQALSLELDELVRQENSRLALTLWQAIGQFFPDDYWAVVQPANLAVTMGDFKQASQLYQQCLASFVPQPDFRHSDCFYGLQALKADRPDPDRYFQVSQIIRGEASWQDFRE